MSVILLANVGLRDVCHLGQSVDPARAGGEVLLKDFPNTGRDLTIPMLLPMVEYVLENHPKLLVILYGTDQPVDTPASERNRDTLHLAGIAKRILDTQLSGRACQAQVRLIHGRNPYMYDEMLIHFREQLGRPDIPLAVGDCCYVGVTGGIPAANTGLMLAAIERAGKDCRVLYLPRGDSRPVQLDIGRQLRDNISKQVLSEWLRSRGFVEALRLMKGMDIPRWVTAVVEQAVARYQFDFESAWRILEEVAIPSSADSPGARDACRRLANDLPDLRSGELSALMQECYYNADMAFARGEYASFLGVCFRFQESLLRCMVEEAYPGISTRVSNRKRDRERWVESLQNHSGLFIFLQSEQVNGERLKWEDCSGRTMEAIVRYTWEGQEVLLGAVRLSQFRSAFDRLRKLNSLAQLRNKSVIAHDFEGVSEQRIKSTYENSGGNESPLDDMAGALKALGITVRESPFEMAARLALTGLD